MQNTKKFTAAFRRVLRKGSDPKEKKNFVRWFSQLNLAEGKIFRDQDEEAEVERRMEQNLRDHFYNSDRRAKIYHFRSWITVAAAAIIFIVTGVLFLTRRPKTEKQVAYSEYFTLAGQRKVITLTDGSTITLNNLSEVSIPENFSDSVREVSIDGEAFFNVVHNPKKPFIVKVGKLKVQVLGTSFNVRHYKSDPMTTVVVTTGKVGVMAKGRKEAWMLTPGKQLIYNTSTENTTENTVTPSDYTNWQNGELVFNNDRIEDICKSLERWYGVTITIRTASLKDKRISLKQNNETLNTVLSMLGKAGNYRFKIQGENVQIW
jgi:transmembrane sensor